MFADAVLIVALFYAEKGMKASKELEEMAAVKDHQKNVTSKESNRAQKAASREEQKQSLKNQKHNTGVKQQKHNIQQPSKNKRN